MFEETPEVTVPLRRGEKRTNEYGLVIDRCEFCREDIAWVETFENPNARTPAGQVPKRVPIDPRPTRIGTLALTHTEQGPRVGEMKHGQAAGFRAAGQPTFIRHIKTCSRAEEMRRGVKTKHARKR